MQLDYHNILFLYLTRTEGSRKEIQKRRHKIAKRVVQRFINKYSSKGKFVGDDAIHLILELQQNLEKEMEKIISRKSIYYWFHLYRRIPPVASFVQESKQTVWLYRNILETAFLKYGRTSTGNELVFSTENNPVPIEKIASGNYLASLKSFSLDRISPEFDKNYGVFLGEFDFNDLLEIYSLEALAFEYWWTTVCERRIYKGGELIVKFDEFYVENDQETEKLMEIYDKRGGALNDLTTTSGVSVSRFKDNPILLPKYNTERLPSNIFPYHLIFGLPYKISDIIKGKFIPNFLWVPFDFSYYYAANQFTEEGFTKKYGFSLKSFVTICFSIVFQAILFSRETGNALDLMNRSYRHFTSMEAYIDELYDLITQNNFQKRITGKEDVEITKEEIALVLNELTLKENREALSLKTMGPRSLIFPSTNEGSFVLDFAALLPILLTITHFVDSNEKEKGVVFEEYVIEKLKDKGFDLWVSQKELKQEDGTAKEIDVSFIYKNVLFICDCKSNKMSFVYGTRGDKKSLEHRKRKITDNLRDVDEQAEWLAKTRQGSNYTIPEQVEYIVPLVVSPFTEYIWSYSDDLWLTEDIPRVLLPRELAELNYDKEIEKIINKGFVRKIN